MTDDPRLVFDGMTWPNPDDPIGVEWRLRNGTPTQQDLHLAAEMIAAYKYLVCAPQRMRNARVAEIRRAATSVRSVSSSPEETPHG